MTLRGLELEVVVIGLLNNIVPLDGLVDGVGLSTLAHWASPTMVMATIPSITAVNGASTTRKEGLQI